METKTKRDKKPSDEQVRTWIEESQKGIKESRDQLIENNTRLVWSVVQRFLNRGYEAEDLFQIGCIGLMKSIDKFDLSYQVKFSTYAVPMIIGEIQRFIRDDGTVKVSRSLKELNHKIRKQKEELTKQLGRIPTINEIAQSLDISTEDVVFANEATRTLSSLHETVYENEGDPITLMDQISDPDESKWFDELALRDVVRHLEKRERLIVFLRYYKDKTQSEVAERLGISQVQVSRLEKKILEKMRKEMVE
ncbi:RNA polymerase sporulation sigma factor SigF [Geomicrobium sp. JCM 19038]|uniref:RNA polymerase sporulation sigma factor SigF n=1 Tax=Geomicrobium sp. JCM 19038 TaxID=1460635 RepID=UPI00045F2E2C|nr:RNA polymerase sporulation sigma factor SigF [Geomicrobium sp. JCM 19038]GAK06591.1 RNA polymerase sporulation specific sigma factor SigF [Geomicrobium sp. JCM 19038]